jgi:transposase-like protein
LAYYIHIKELAMSVLLSPWFHNEAAAVARLEAIGWPNGPICPHCGGMDRITPVKGGRIGLRRCGDCKKQFSCKVGTVFEDSKVPLHKWFQAAHLLASSKKGISSHQLHRTLGVTYKTAWFMSHRLREAMRAGEPGDMTFMGGEGKVFLRTIATANRSGKSAQSWRL